MKHQKKEWRPQHETRTLYDRLDAFFLKNSRSAVITTVSVSLLLALLLFDPKPSLGGDDMGYILQARNLVERGDLPIGWRTPGYALALSVFVLIGATSVIALKFTSILFYVLSVISFYVIFRDQLSPLVLHVGMFLFAINALVLEFASQTYAEELFLLVELWAFYFFRKSMEEAIPRQTTRIMLAVAIAVASFYVRVVGIVFCFVIVLYWLSKREWKAVVVASVTGLVIYAPLRVAEAIYRIPSMSQANVLFLVNPYEPTTGYETLSGFLERAFNNLLVHVQYIIPKTLSLPVSEELSLADGRVVPTAAALFALFLSLVVLLGLRQMARRDRKDFRVLSWYTIAYLIFIFFMMQNVFASVRYMLPLVPILVLALFHGIEELPRHLKISAPSQKGFVVACMAMVVLSNISAVVKNVSSHLPVLRENLSGNEFYGYTQDWVNYVKACQWIGARLPKDSVGIICRKPEFLQVYAGGYLAHGVYQVESANPDTIVANWKKWRMSHLLYDNFQWTGTLRRYVQPVAEKYPGLFVLLHQEGTEGASFVYRLNYEALSFNEN